MCSGVVKVTTLPATEATSLISLIGRPGAAEPAVRPRGTGRPPTPRGCAAATRRGRSPRSSPTSAGRCGSAGSATWRCRSCPRRGGRTGPPRTPLPFATVTEDEPFAPSAARFCGTCCRRAGPAVGADDHDRVGDVGGVAAGRGAVRALEDRRARTGPAQGDPLADEQVVVVDQERARRERHHLPAGQASRAAWMPADASDEPLPYVDALTLAQTVVRPGTPPGTPGLHTVRRSAGSTSATAGGTRASGASAARATRNDDWTASFMRVLRRGGRPAIHTEPRRRASQG